ncbi:MAG: PAS domain S-box protein [Candidatus Hodarchaeales archaeon]|jgi:PAS domain S-box-containing protein
MPRVLLVDDDKNLLDVAKNILAREEPTFDLISATSAHEALQKLTKESIDVIVADYDMPGMTGLDLLAQLRNDNNKIPFIVFTGKGREEVAIEALNLGANRYLNKAGEAKSLFAELAHAIRSLIQHKETEKALSDRERQFLALFEEAQNPILVVNEAGQYIDANPAALAFLECTREELLSKMVWDFAPLAILEQQKQEHSPFVDRRTRETEYLIHGKVKTLLLNVVPLTLAGETVLFGIGQDISARKRAEEALQQNEARFRLMFEYAPIGYHSLDRDGIILDVSAGWLNLLGYARTEVVGRQFKDFLAPSSRDRFECSFAQFKADGDLRGIEYELVHKDSSSLAVVCDGTAQYDEEGNFERTHCAFRNITERKKAQEHINYLAGLVDNVSDAIISTDQHFTIRSWNRGAQEMYGWHPEEAMGKNVGDLLQNEFPSRSAEEVIGEFAKAGKWEGDVLQKTKDGRPLNIYSKVSAITDSNGGATGAVAINRDITAQKQAQKALKESEEKYRQLIELIPYGITEIDASGEFIFANSAYHRMLGYNPDELVGKPMFDTWADENERESARKYLQMLVKEQPEPVPYFCQIRRKDGQIIDEQVDWEYKFDKQGNVEGFISVITDITERKQVEERINFLVRVLETSPISVIVTDKAYNITYVNPATETLFGYEKEEIIGNDPGMFNADPQAEEIQKDIYTALSRNQVWKGEILNKKKDGTLFYIGASVYRLLDKEGNFLALVGFQEGITERKQVEKALRESEERFRMIFQESAIGIGLYDSEGDLITINQAGLDIAGISHVSDVRGWNLNNSITLTKGKKVQLRQGKTVRYQTPVDFEEIKRRKLFPTTRSGIAHFDYLITPLSVGKDGSVKGYLTSVQDITDRKWAEQALQESEERFRELADLLPETVFELDLEGNFTFANRRGLEISGYTQEDIDKGLNVLQLFLPEDRGRIREIVQRKLAGETVRIQEYTAMRKDGSLFPVLIHSSPIIYQDMPMGLRGIVIDITEQKKAEEALRVSEEHYRATIDSMEDIIHVIDADNRFVLANAAFQQRIKELGFEIDALGQSMFEVFPPMPKKLQEEYQQVFSTGKSVVTEEETMIAKRKFNAMVSKTPIFNDGEVCQVVTIIRDITKYKKAVEKLQQQKEELSEFVHAMAHDLRNNLLSIEGYAETLHEEYNKSYVEKIAQLAQSLNELVRHSIILADAGLVVEKKEEIDLSELARTAAEMVIPESITFKHNALPIVVGDREKILQIFRNLFENAVIHGNPQQIEVKQRTAEGGAMLLVTNDGKLIPPEHRSEMFRRGFTTKEGGWGMGLPIVKKAVQAHGWEISLDPVPETTFKIFIPTS